MIDEQLDGSKPNPLHLKRRRRRGSVWTEMPILLAVAIVVAIGVRAFALQTFFIPSPSMEHTLNVNDRVLVDELIYRFRSPARGEIVVFTSPVTWRNSPDEKDFIKRVIGVGGDHVACCDSRGRLTINGTAVDEPFLNTDVDTLPASPSRFAITVPPGRLWVMGDNRFHSGDSQERYYVTGNIDASTIATSAVIGRAFVIFWPLGRARLLRVPAGFARVETATSG